MLPRRVVFVYHTRMHAQAHVMCSPAINTYTRYGRACAFKYNAERPFYV